MKLMHDIDGWYWVDDYATSQHFSTREAAEEAATREAEEMERLGLTDNASAGVLEWIY